MALNITAFNLPKNVYGAGPIAPGAPIASQVAALGAASGAIPGGALFCVIPDEDQRAIIAADVSGGVPADAMKLKAGVDRWFVAPASGCSVKGIAG